MTIIALTDQQIQEAERRLRRFSDETLRPSDLGAEIDFWLRHRALLQGDLDAEDYSEADEAILRAGVEYADVRLDELGLAAERLARAMRIPGYPPVQPHDDLTARFAAAKYCDLVGLIETLTGQQAISTGNGRHRIRCPWHDDRNPSLVVFPPGRGWWCPVCDIGGDAVAFVSRLNSIPAVEALGLVETLADTVPAAWGGS
jgi:CHC2 zinc finger